MKTDLWDVLIFCIPILFASCSDWASQEIRRGDVFVTNGGVNATEIRLTSRLSMMDEVYWGWEPTDEKERMNIPTPALNERKIRKWVEEGLWLREK